MLRFYPILRIATGTLLTITPAGLLAQSPNTPASTVQDSQSGSSPYAPAAAPSDGQNESQPIVLSPFEVDTSQDKGYDAANTLAGSRISTSLADTPAAISVFNSQFLQDTDALDSVAQLQYMLNGGRLFNDQTGLGDNYQEDYEPQIRGSAATVTRDYFDNPANVELDAYNTERIDFSRGPNDVLYGIGSPGGVINTTTKQAEIGANFDDGTFRVGSWDDYRETLDVNHSIGKTLAFRINAVNEDSKSWQDFSDLDMQGIAGAVTYRPFSRTSIEVQTEYDDRREVNVDYFPTNNYMGTWLAAGRLLPATDGTPVTGTATNTSQALVWDPTARGGGLMNWYGTQQTTPGPTSPEIAGLVQDFTNFAIIPRDVNLNGSGGSSNAWDSFTTVAIDQQLGPVAAQLAYNEGRYSRLATYPILWNQYGVYADVNPTLPNGSPNPNQGQYYVQGTPGYRILSGDWDTWRFMLTYKLDLSAYHLGVHNLTGLLSRDEGNGFTDAQYLVNTTPPGNATYTANETTANNRLYTRTYLNFNSNNMNELGAIDANLYPVNNVASSATGTPVTEAYRRITNAVSASSAIDDTAMVADQSSFLDNRVVLTAGIRNDVEDAYPSGGATANSVTGVFGEPHFYYAEAVYEGNTRTVGGIVYALPWLGLFYNNSDDFSPQTQFSISNQLIGPKYGQDQDFGVKVNFWQRAYLTITHYQLNQVNSINTTDTTFDGTIIPAINDIWVALNQSNNEINTVAKDTYTSSGKGWEIELLGTILPGWNLMANASQTIVQWTDVYPRTTAYVAANQAAWLQSAGVPLVAGFTTGVAGTNPTVGSAVSAIASTLQLDQFTDAEIPRLTTEYAANAFTTYTFQSGGWLIKDTTIGFGFTYRGPSVLGYNSATNYSPMYGPSNLVYNGMLAKDFKLRKGLLRIQVNVANLFNNTNLIPLVGDQTGTYQYMFQQPQSWSVTTSYKY